jgi:peroxiredoxin
LETGLVVSSLLLWVVVLLNLLLTLALIRRVRDSKAASGLKAGQIAPAFTAHTLDGELVTNTTYVGRNVAFVFISTHCVPCRELLPKLEPLGSIAAHARTELLLVSTDELEETRVFAVEMNTHLPILVAPAKTNSFLHDYKAPGTPFFCLVNAQGKVQLVGHPNLDQGEWKSLVDSWAKQSVAII